MKTTQLKMERLMRLGCFFFLSALVLWPAPRAQACQTDLATNETHFVIDTDKKKYTLNSAHDSSTTEVTECAGDKEKFLKISLAPLMYEQSPLAKENYSNDPAFINQQCHLASEIPLAAAQNYDIHQLSGEKFHALRSCFVTQLTEKGGRTIAYDTNQKDCQIRPLDGARSSLILTGDYCYIKLDPRLVYDVKPVLKPDCLEAQFLADNKISPQDIEARMVLWTSPSNSDSDPEIKALNKRNFRFTILPGRGSLPTAKIQDDASFAFSSVLSTNIHQGPINLRPMGAQRVQIASGYLVQNLTQEICRNGRCLRSSNFIAPIAGHAELFKVSKTSKKLLASWDFPMKMPSNWMGLAVPPISAFLGRVNPFVMVSEKLSEEDTYEIVSKFYEPRSFLEELASNVGTDDQEHELEMGATDGNGTVPEFPKLPGLKANSEFAKFPSFSWDSSPGAYAQDLGDFKKEWSHYYDRVCDQNNSHCQKLQGLAKPFVQIATRFQIGKVNATGTYDLRNIQTRHLSETFGDYQQALTGLPEIRCQ